MLEQLLSHSPDLQRLQDEGYNLGLQSDYLLLKDVPYVTNAGTVMRGIIASELTTAGNAAARPSNHLVWFIGSIPHDTAGRELEDIINEKVTYDLGGGLVASCRFSSKPAEGYPDYYEKMTAYADMLAGYAHAVQPGVTSKTFPPIVTADGDSVFRYTDSASSRAQLGALNDKLKLENVAIIGLGGTGAYILDLIAKTSIQHIHLYDGDTFYTHNAFRAPGAATLDELNSIPKKVDYFQGKYSALHGNVVAHPVYITESNVSELRNMDFVFVAAEGGSTKRLIIEKLEEFGVAFIDTGMGVDQDGDSLGGIIRVTASDSRQHAHIWDAQRIDFTDLGKNEYDRNIQIADLNALNAALAVIKWKKLYGFYSDLEHEYSSSYTIDGNHMLNEDQLT